MFVWTSSTRAERLDATTAFLNGTLEEVFMKQPKGFVVPGNEELVCRLKKSIYKLKQSPQCWNLVLDSKLKEIGFSQSSHDPCIYYRNERENMLIVGVYVDDIILAGVIGKMAPQYFGIPVPNNLEYSASPHHIS